MKILLTMKGYILAAIFLMGITQSLLASGPVIHSATRVDSLITNMRSYLQSDVNSKGYFAIAGVYSRKNRDTNYVQGKSYVARWGKYITNKNHSILVILCDSDGTIKWHREVTPVYGYRTKVSDIALSDSNDVALSIDGYKWYEGFPLKVNDDTVKINTYSEIIGVVLKFTANGQLDWFHYPKTRYRKYANTFKICFDSYNNLYYSGIYSDTIWVGNVKLFYPNASSTYQQLAYLAKISPKGQVLWARNQMSRPDAPLPRKLLQAQNNLYALSSFGSNSTIYMDTFNFSSLATGNNLSALVMAFDTSGHFKWHYSTGQTNYSYWDNFLRMPIGVADKRTGNLAISFFNADTIFTNKAKTKYLKPVERGIALCVLDSNGSKKSFDILPMDIANSGSHISSLAFTKTGYVCVSGSMNGPFKIGKQSFKSNGGYDAFIAGTDSSGQFVWATTTGSAKDDDSVLTMFQNPNGDLKLLSMFRKQTILGKDTLRSYGKQQYAITTVEPYRFPPQLKGKATHYVYADSTFNYRLPRFSDYSPKIWLGGEPSGLTYSTATGRIDWTTSTSDLGTHKFKIYIKDKAGIDSMTFTIHVINHLKATLKAPGQLCLNDAIEPSVDAGSSGKLNYTWLYGDGSFSGKERPSHQYQDTGTYLLQAIIENQLGQKDTLSQSIKVNPIPTAGFSNSNECIYDSLQLNDTSLTNGANLMRHQWQIDQTDHPVEAATIRQYVTEGVYQIQLKVTNIHGCKDSVTKSIAINKGLQLSSVNLDTTICSDQGIDFQTNVTWTKDQLKNVTWQFEDSVIVKDQNVQSRHIYSRGGVYRPIITVKGESGCSKTWAGLVKVHQKPNAYFERIKLCVGNPVTLQNQSSQGDTTVIGYEWLTDDNPTSSKEHLPVQFSEAGTKDITLIAVDNNQCTDTITQRLRIFEKPQVVLHVPDSCSNASTVITASIKQVGKDTIDSYKWGINGKNLGELAEQPYRYGAEKKANINLVVGTRNGCIVVASRTVTVAQPEPATLSIANGCMKDTLELNPLYNADNLKEYTYDADNIKLIEEPGVLTALYPNEGKASLQFITHSKQGCRDTFTTTTEAWSLPKASFAYHRKGNQTLYFKVSDSTATSYSWQIDGETKASKHFAHQFDNPGTYPISLTSTNDKGCKNDTVRLIEVYPLGIGSISDDQITAYQQGGNLLVKSNGLPVRVSLHSIDGKMIYQSPAKSNMHTINSSTLSTGVYLITISNQNSAGTRKVVIR